MGMTDLRIGSGENDDNTAAQGFGSELFMFIITSIFGSAKNRKRENKGKVGRERHVLRFGFVAMMTCLRWLRKPTSDYNPNREYVCPRELA